MLVFELIALIKDEDGRNDMIENAKPPIPFLSYNAVRDDSMFFGRVDELRLLLEAISKRQCCSIVGSRRVGKSTLLKYLAEPEVHQSLGYNLHNRLFLLTDWRLFLQKKPIDFYRL